jgi:DNA repair protein RadC
MAKRLTSISNQTDFNEDEIISAALQILERRITYQVDKPIIQSPDESKDYVKLQLAERPYEVFACLLLDSRHRVIAFEELFRGTIDGCSVHPREVVKAALAHNAAAVILAHNHPSGNAEPSQADRRITERLRDALALVDVRVLDHLVVGQEVVSFAERGLV